MLMLVDSAGLWYRSFYGLPSSLRGPDGSPINAIRGFIDGLATLVRTRQPDTLVCALDLNWRPTWRTALLPSYKAHRVAADGVTEDEPDNITPQIPVILHVLTAIGIATAGADDHEADDVMATLAAHTDGPVEVVTGDRDMFQVVSPTTRVVYIARGITKAETYDETAVLTRFGVPATRYVDYAVLRGDASDGLPGVAGIGEKTAAKLITQFGDINAIRAAAEDPHTAFPPRARGAITAATDYLDVAPTVVTTRTNAPVGDVDATIPTDIADPAALNALVEQYGIANPVQRIRDALGLA